MSEAAAVWKELASIKHAQKRAYTDGPVTDVNAKDQTARIQIGTDDDGQPVKGPWVSYAQWAGGMKGHVPVTVGQQMTMHAPGGDLRRASLSPLTFSDKNKSPSEKPDENVFTYGDVKVEVRGKEVIATIGKSSVKITEKSITHTVDGVSVEHTKDGVQQKKGFQKHDGKNVGKDHKHGSVVTGSAKTGDPEE